MRWWTLNVYVNASGGWWWCHLWWDELWIIGVVHCPLPTHTRGAVPFWLPEKMQRLGFFWVVVSNTFYCHPYLGKVPILTNIFQGSWNHQPVFVDSKHSQLRMVYICRFFVFDRNQQPFMLVNISIDHQNPEPSVLRWLMTYIFLGAWNLHFSTGLFGSRYIN